MVAVLGLPGRSTMVDHAPASGPSGSLSKSSVKVPVTSLLLAFRSPGGSDSMPHPRNSEAAITIPILLHFMHAIRYGVIVIETSLNADLMRDRPGNSRAGRLRREGELVWKWASRHVRAVSHEGNVRSGRLASGAPAGRSCGRPRAARKRSAS